MSRVWLITGGSDGLGRALAETVLAAGDRVVATARRPDRLDDLRAEYGERFRRMALDVADEHSAQTSVLLAMRAFGRLDVAVPTGGHAGIAAVEDVTDHALRTQMEANFFGVVNVVRAVLPVMRRQGAGHVVPVASLGGRTSTPGLAAYQSARWAVEGFAGVLAEEVAPFGIKVSVVDPGEPHTGWTGARMTAPPVSEPYLPTVGALAGTVRERRVRAPGDPAEAAAAILGLTRLRNPPPRLVLGTVTAAAA
ncbi:SDR family oxidoreductase [Actinomadura monticuli]|uniref:SDR family oxidoreductase n=1 Tax=Actinomadura monticuli TaxID=3097367 RepID=A0ABV4Q6T0_9ACTN